MTDVPRSLSEMKTPRSGTSGGTIGWNVALPGLMSPQAGKFTQAMKVWVPWYKRKPFYILVAAVAIALLVQIDIDTQPDEAAGKVGALYGLVTTVFNWVRTQPWLTLAVGGVIGIFIQNRPVQLVSRHEIPPEAKE